MKDIIHCTIFYHLLDLEKPCLTFKRNLAEGLISFGCVPLIMLLKETFPVDFQLHVTSNFTSYIKEARMSHDSY